MSWEVYLALSDARGEGGNVRLAYDGKDLEIMTIGNLHEHLKELLIRIIKAVASWCGIAHVACGQTTWQSEDAERGLEADLSYYFDPEKIRVGQRRRWPASRRTPPTIPGPTWPSRSTSRTPRSIGRRSTRPCASPRSGGWSRGRTLIIEQLQPDGSYAPAEASRFLPIRAEDVLGWLYAEDVGQEDAWYRRLNQWAMGLGGRA